MGLLPFQITMMNKSIHFLGLLACTAWLSACTTPLSQGDQKTQKVVKQWRQSLSLTNLENQYSLPSGLLSAVMHQESAGNPYATSRVGAVGLYQFMPKTAKQYKLDDRTHPKQSANAAAVFLSQLKRHYKGDVRMMLAAYNWGIGNVDNLIKRVGERSSFDQMPKETQNYIARITMLRKHY